MAKKLDAQRIESARKQQQKTDKREEEIKHIKILSQLKEDKEKLLKAQIEKHLKYNPKGGITNI